MDILEVGEEYHGSPLIDKKQGTIRVGFININSLPKLGGAAKYDAIKCSIQASEVDFLGIAEPNKCWHLLEPEHTWREVSKTWWRDSNSVVAYNCFDIGANKIYQPGGSITTAINQMAHKVIASGVDETLLGRWSWLTIRGKNNILTTIYTMYRPCKSTSSENTTYSQQQLLRNRTNEMSLGP